MPAPTASQLEGVASGAMQAAGLKGENAPGIAKALAKTCGEAFSMFMSQAQVLPGIPAAAPPPAGSGSTVGPGMLLPIPAGGPSASQLEGIALSALNDEGIEGENAADLAKVMAASLEQGLTLFTAQVMVAPGIAIAGFTTTSPGSLM